jgi:hypothetical protein
MLWAAGFAEYEVLYTFQTFMPTILSAEGYSIVKWFRHSVVIRGAVIPGYVLGGHAVQWLDRKLQFCSRLLRSDGVELCSDFRGRLVKLCLAD